MATVYIEARPKGRQEGSPIEDYVVEDHADHVFATFKTQHEAIAWAKNNGHSPTLLVSDTSTTRKRLITVARPYTDRGNQARAKDADFVILGDPYGKLGSEGEKPVKSEETNHPAVAIDTTLVYHRQI